MPAGEWIVAPGPASLEVGASLAAKLGASLARIENRDFPDGESKIRILDPQRDKRVIVVQSLYPPIDKHLMQLYLICHKLSEEGAEVNAVVPYLGYARQDKEFLKGEVVSLGVIGHLMRSVGVKRLVTVDIHSAEGLGLFSIPVFSASAIPILAEYVTKNYSLSSPLAVSPDFGASQRVEAFASVMKTDYVTFRKTRNRQTGDIITEEKNLNLLGRDAVIVDDIISSGTSVAKCAQLLKKYGAGKVVVACTHALLIGNAVERMQKEGVDDIVGTNSVPSKYSKVDIAPIVASYFQTL